MPEALARLKTDVTHADVVRAIKEYDRLGPSSFSLSMVTAQAGVMSWSGNNAVTRTKPYWAQLMNWPRVSAWPRVISKAGRLVPSQCSGTSVSPSRISNNNADGGASEPGSYRHRTNRPLGRKKDAPHPPP